MELKINNINTNNISLNFEEIKDPKKLIDNIKNSFSQGEELIKYITVTKTRIKVNLPLLFYIQGGISSRGRYPKLNKIPPRFLTRVKDIDKIIMESIK